MKTLLILGDLHCGSRYALRSEPDNAIQRTIYSKWRDMIKDVGHVDGVVLNGDLCDGSNYKSKGLGLWTPDIMEQVDDAVNLTRMINTDQYYGTQGSIYHTSDNISSDKLVLKMLGKETDVSAVFNDELAIRVEDCRFHFMHSVGVSSSAFMYRSTPIAREMMLAELNKEEYGGFKGVFRHHAHYFCYVGFGNSFGMICPCWKGRDEYAKRRTLAYMPHLGYILLKVDGDKASWEPHIFTLKGQNIIEEVTV